MTEEDVLDCVSVLGCRREGFPQTYLGLPLSNTKLRLNAFAPHCKMWQVPVKPTESNEMGHAALINVVLDSQLVYDMAALLIHYYKNYLPWPFQNLLRGGQEYKPPGLMSGINQGGRFLLTKKHFSTWSLTLSIESSVIFVSIHVLWEQTTNGIE